jgi:predicted nucleic acid-binding protein
MNRVLVDTNVLLRLAQVSSSDQQSAKRSLELLQNSGHVLCLVPQIIYEYWAVCTRPLANNGLGLSVQDVHDSVKDLLKDFEFHGDERGIFDEWIQLVLQFAVKGKVTYDARLVAAMKQFQIPKLLTFNTSDFMRYPHITVISPSDRSLML